VPASRSSAEEFPVSRYYLQSGADLMTVVSALVAYERRILPLVHYELTRWEAFAVAIPDPVLRAAALSGLRGKRRNAEATAVFAILAPRAHRARALRAMTSLQIAIDYLDSLGEAPVNDPLADGLALHRAIDDAVSPDAPTGDWYRHHPQREDGGYLAALVAACRAETARLPARGVVMPALRRAARRCGEGQSHTHAAVRTGVGGLEAWAREQPAAPGYLWWEIAAGASSSVAVHALLAAAADRRTTADQSELIDALYFPPIGALTVLLDDLIDRDDDIGTGQHSYLDYCTGEQQAADRIGLLAERARAATMGLQGGRRHRAILAGVAGFYLSAPAMGSGYARPIRERLLQSHDWTVRPIMLAMRLRGNG
jgi:tetraprenyl-beta-curcumene synthase